MHQIQARDNIQAASIAQLPRFVTSPHLSGGQKMLNLGDRAAFKKVTATQALEGLGFYWRRENIQQPTFNAHRSRNA
jgi:hypothetical protein